MALARTKASRICPETDPNLADLAAAVCRVRPLLRQSDVFAHWRTDNYSISALRGDTAPGGPLHGNLRPVQPWRLADRVANSFSAAFSTFSLGSES